MEKVLQHQHVVVLPVQKKLELEQLSLCRSSWQQPLGNLVQQAVDPHPREYWTEVESEEMLDVSLQPQDRLRMVVDHHQLLVATKLEEAVQRPASLRPLQTLQVFASRTPESSRQPLQSQAWSTAASSPPQQSMGKRAKSSRKGKKAWRANISTEDIEDFFDNSTKDALSGGSLADVPSESLFYVDKSRDLSAKRKIEKKRDKVLHFESLLQKNAFVQPVPSSTTKKSKKKSKDAKKAKDAAEECQKDAAAIGSGLVDIWNEKGEKIVKTKRKSVTSIIPAVEVDPQGCSFNPPSESHQDALASAVADEMQKVYRDELGPEPVPLTVPGEIVDEENVSAFIVFPVYWNLASAICICSLPSVPFTKLSNKSLFQMYFLDADDGSGDDDENLIEDGNLDVEKRLQKTKLVTKVEKNRRARRKEQLRTEAEAKKVENLSKEIDSLSDIIQEIAKEDEEKQKRHLRRVVAKQERLKCCPPRLGKRNNIIIIIGDNLNLDSQTAPVQSFILSEEITVPSRQLKGCSHPVARYRDSSGLGEKRTGLSIKEDLPSVKLTLEVFIPTDLGLRTAEFDNLWSPSLKCIAWQMRKLCDQTIDPGARARSAYSHIIAFGVE
nr:ribosome biogenesis protein NOP53 [Ipomoea batatas]